MSTRSSARNIFPPLDNPELTIRRRSRADPTLLNDFEMAAEGNSDLPVPKLWSMEELCQPSLNGRGGPITPIAIQATNFGLKNDMIQQVHNSFQFHGLPGDDANKHLDKFLHVTQSIKVNGVTDDALRLYLFPHSLTHHATAWFDRLLRNSINTFEQMAKMFLGRYFPPSMVTKLRNEITNFRQHPDESLFEAWECYKLSIDRCPNHNMLSPPLAKLRTYMLQEPIKGASHDQNPPKAYQAPAYQALVYQALVHQPQIPQPQVVTTNEFTNFMKANDAILKNMKTNMTYLTNLNLELKHMFGQFMKMNTASSSSSRTLPGNIITNPKEELKGITTRSGTAYQGPTIPTTSSSLPPGDILLLEAFLNDDPSLPLPSQRNYLPQVRKELKICEAKTDKSLIDEPPEVELKDLPPHLEYAFLEGDNKRSFLETERALIDVFKGELTLRVGKEAITFNLDQTSRYSANYNDMTANRIDVIDMACEEYSQEVLNLSDVIASGNPTPYYDPIVSTTSPTLTPFENSDFLLEEVDGDILLLKSFLNDDPSSPPPNQGNYLPQVRKELKICEAKTDKSSIYEPPEVEIKDLPPHLEYVFLEGDDKLQVIIMKDLSIEEKIALITEDFEPAVQHRRRVNPKIHDVIKNEVLKLLDAGLIYPISDSPWENELIPTRLVTGWRVCIDYRKLNEATRKDHFPLPFMDQMLERLVGNEYYCFLDGFFGYFQIPIDPRDQEKTTFTSPYGTFAYRRMPFSLCNAPGTFQRAENLADDHLSRLENTYENVLDPKEINENFPLETLSMVTSRSDSGTPWFADFANYHAGNFLVK
nr:reverse transcriptase domain-containing protein [Tanacetum cinerariifolium]